jgi:tRNA pseudouridine38-40 synthase
MKRSFDEINQKEQESTTPADNAEVKVVEESKNEAAEAKKPKIEEEEKGKEIAANPAGEKKTRYPKRKVALLLGYKGTNYIGLQRNPGCKTIEAELEKAIVKAGGIDEWNAGSFTKVNWQRCARTDKGVHACLNVVSLKLVLDPPGVLGRINDNLPEDIRVFAIRRTTGGFDSKNSADSRIYEYLLPGYVLAPEEPKQPTDAEPSTASADAAPAADQPVAIPDYAVTPELINKLNEYLEEFTGTNNFYNYTIRTEKTDPSAKRYIMSFKCTGPFTVDGVDFVRFEIHGQSFMLHQIRRMIGMVIFLIKRNLPKDVILATFERRAPVPTAPSEGLLLQQCVYKVYNEGKGRSYEPVNWEGVKDQAEKFRSEQIYAHIASIEKDTRVFAEWTAKQAQYLIDYQKLLDDWRNDRPEEPYEYRGRAFREAAAAAAEAEEAATGPKED